MIAIKVLFLLWMSLGLNCRITWRKQRQCNKAGQILENGSFETLNKTQRKYVCQADFVSNIPNLEQLTFNCDVEKNNKRRYVWRALFTGGLLYLRNVTCESKTKCSDPPWPKDMTREVTTRYVMPVPINNDTKAINDFYTGDTVKYSCKTGFILFNDHDTSSFSNGGDFDDYNRKYEKSPPSSRITAPPDISSGFTNIICDAKGFWNGFPESQLYFGECQAIQCNATMFDDISNGNISNLKATYEFLEEMKLECEDGYRHKGGVKSAICMSPSSFSNLFLGDFGCERIQCIEPQSPGNGYLKIDHIYVNGTVSYECEPGYELIGYSKWKCQSNGKWDHDCVKCAHEDAYCPPPCLPPGAITKTSSGIYQIGDVLDFTCKSGKYYGGSTNRTCMKNRYWSGTPIDCTGTSMVDSRVGIELVSALKQISKNRTISDTVNSKTINVWNTKGVDLYLLVDISKVSTLEHMNTTLSFVYALLPELGINDGDTGTRVALIFFATNSCWMFDQHNKSDDSEGPFKSYEDVIKELKLYNNKSELQKIKQNTSDGTDIAAALNDVYDQIKTKRKLPGRKSQQVLLVISDGRLTTTDDPTDSASKLKDDFDVEIYSIVIGSLTDTKGLETMRNLASHIENEQHFFKISTDESNFKRIMSSMINRDSLNVSCGSTNPNLTSISNASENRFEVNAKKNAWPWMADLRTLHSHECGGSVIKDQWILTAAHCFDYKHITKVHLGKTNLNGLRDGNGDEYIISTIHKHEHYNKGSHKYDIALVRLSQKINRKLEVLPVCLWDKTIQSETTGVTYTRLFNKTYGVVTGWGKTNTLSKTKKKLAVTLKQMQMEVKSSKECLENLTSQEKAHVSPGLMFCAGGEEIVDGKNQIIDACEGDSGGPFVVRHPLDERKFIQTGIVSFGFGCKQSGKYGFYTKLTEELLDWINDTIEKKEKEKEEKKKEEKKNSTTVSVITFPDVTKFELDSTTVSVITFPDVTKFELVRKCRKIQKISGGSVFYEDGRNVGTRAIYRCRDAFSLFPENVDSSLCNRKSEWEPVPPKCFKKAIPDVPDNGYIADGWKDFLLHSESYEVCCDQGYEVQSGGLNGTKYCMRIRNNNGILEPRIRCVEEAGCDPDDYPKTDIYYNNNKSLAKTKIPSGTVVILTCQDGYSYYRSESPMRTHLKRICSNGTIERAPECEEKKCLFSGYPTSRYTTHKEYLSLAVLVADGQYIEHGQAIEVYCYRTDYFELYINASDTYPTEFRTECRFGKFEKKKEEFPICIERGCDLSVSKESCIWTNDPDSCKPTNFKISSGTLLQVGCKTGYTLYQLEDGLAAEVNGAVSIACRRGSYNSIKLYKCIPDELVTVLRGQGERFPGELDRVTCRFSIEKSYFCTDPCLIPEIPFGFAKETRSGEIAEFEIGHNKSISVKCDRGYTILNQMTARCRNGEFDVVPVCTPNPCEFAVNDGMMIFRNYSLRRPIEKGDHTFLNGTILEMNCKPGYKLLDKISGGVIRSGTLSMCVLGNWTNSFQCVPKGCKVPEFEHVLPVEKQVYAHAQKVTLKCEDGFHFFESMNSIEITCDLGMWSNLITTKCTPDPCDLVILEGTSYIIDSKIYTGNDEAVYSFPNGTSAQIVCKNGFKMADINITIADDERRYSTCIKGHWTQEYHCIPATCDLPNNVAKLSNPKRKAYIQGETISNFHCDAGYRLSSHESMTCLSDGTWSAVVECIKNVKKQNPCHNSFDRGHKWCPNAHTGRYTITLQTNNKWMSLCECKNSCLQVPNKSCVAISYNLQIGKCEGFSGKASFLHVNGPWSARVYIRQDKDFGSF